MKPLDHPVAATEFVILFACVPIIFLTSKFLVLASGDFVERVGAKIRTQFLQRKLRRRLRKIIRKNRRDVPPSPLFDIIISVGENIYSTSLANAQLPPFLTDPPKLFSASSEQLAKLNELSHEWKVGKKHLFEAITQSMSSFVLKLPRISNAPFHRPLAEAINVPAAIFDLINPLRSQELAKYNLTAWLLGPFDAKMGALGTPQTFSGPQDAIPQTYLKGTPFLPLFNVLVPFYPFTEINRCAHHWCLGHTRRGKTTFLRHLIKYDLEAVVRGECSLVVIDSKTLISEMRTLRQFAPGGPLDGKLILIDSDEPFPLNPFHLPPAQARSVLTYMLGSMSSASGLQSGALSFYVDAVLQSGDKSLQRLLDYARLKTTGKEVELPNEIDDFDKQTADWFRYTRKTLHPATSGGLEQRLANFLAPERAARPFMKNLQADRWQLDLFKELDKGGKVLLVDTDWEKNHEDGTNLFGRLIIALLEQLATRRMKHPGKPIWVYIDEASDYLKNDENFVQILIKAAAAKVGTTVAYQYKGLIDTQIEKALENAEIHANCEQRGMVQLTIEERPMSLHVSKLEFKHQPQMKPAEYQAMRQALSVKFPYKTKPTPEDIVEPTEYK